MTMQQSNRVLQQYDEAVDVADAIDVGGSPAVAEPSVVPTSAPASASKPTSRLDAAIARARDALLVAQRPDGHWVFELEADATIPAEYVLLTHFLGEPDAALEQRIAVYLRRVRLPGGGWPLYHDGAFNMSASVKAYFALKAIGDSPSLRTCARRATRSSRTAGPSTRTCSRASCSRCSACCRGRRCR